MTAIGAKSCTHTSYAYIYTYLSFSLYLSSYLSLRSDINCLLPNLIRNFRRRDNLTSFLFSLTRSPSLLYRGLVPRIFLSTSEWANERTSERVQRARPCPSLPIQFISLRSTHVYPCPPPRLSSRRRTRRKKVCQIDWRRATVTRAGVRACPSFSLRSVVLNSNRKGSIVEFTQWYEKRKYIPLSRRWTDAPTFVIYLS